jgi:exosortase/archaeosortase family protein
MAFIGTKHQKMLVFSGFFILFYLMIWLLSLGQMILQGNAIPLLNMGYVGLGIQTVLKHRSIFTRFQPQEDDRILGYALMILGMGLFVYAYGVQQSFSFQSIAIDFVILGMVWSHWGLRIFRRFPIELSVLLLGLYPNLEYLTHTVISLFVPIGWLEVFMAKASAVGLTLGGLQAGADGPYVRIPPQHSILIYPGCSGFGMALVLIGLGFLIGRMRGFSGAKTCFLMTIGWALALLSNILRIMLMTIAIVHWGTASFEFWHGPIGGQIFSSFLFTAYYYVAIGFMNLKITRKSIL